jgi:outer membrane murein-binding lipoprotein Lpp
MKNTIWIIGVLLLATNFLHGQVSRNAVEASQNQQAMAANQAQLERDINELEAFKVNIKQFEAAYAIRDAVKIASLKTNLLTAMQREIEQGENKIAQDKQELNQSKSETASSAREKGRSRRDLATPDGDIGDGRDLRDDRRDKYDDQRDAQDDRSDLQQQILRTGRQKEIYAMLQAFTFSFEPSLEEKAVASKALIHEFPETMERDIAATKSEIAEDEREAAEDGRERREDRREIRERMR